MIIYKVTNTINNKVYIGQTTLSIKIRWSHHTGKYSKSTYLSNAIQKYGKDNFIIEQIDSAETLEELNLKEEYWIKVYDSLNPEKGYNIRQGGTNRKLAQRSIEIIRKKATGRKHSEETKALMRITRKNPSEEIRRKMSESRKGKPQSEESKLKRAASLKNRTYSPQALLNIKEGQKRRRLKEKLMKEKYNEII